MEKVLDFLYHILPFTIAGFVISFVCYRLMIMVLDKRNKQMGKKVVILFYILIGLPFVLGGVWLVLNGIMEKELVNKILLILFGIFLIGTGASGSLLKTKVG